MTDAINALLEPIQNRRNAATPGPWFQGRASDRYENTREVYSEREVSATSEDVATFIHHPEDAEFIANAPTDQARLLAAVQAVTGIAEIKMNSEHGDPAFVQGWECAIEEMNARLVAALGGEA